MNIPEIVEFKFNDPKTGTGQYGEWYCYGIMNRGVEKVFFPTKYLNDKIRAFAPLQGKELEIVKTEGEGNTTNWLVNLPGEAQSGHIPSTLPPQSCNCEERFEKMLVWAKKVEGKVDSLTALVEHVAGKDTTTLHVSIPPKATVSQAAEALGGEVEEWPTKH